MTRNEVPGARLAAAALMPEAICLVVVAAWWFAKCSLFDHLEYTSDLFSNLQITWSWFLGRPLLWENGFGDHKGLHNYYIDPLLFPLTRTLGARGLFLGTAILFAAAAFGVFALARRDAGPRLPRYLSVVGATMLGPIAFWIWDNPTYGWHAEILYLPLSVLLAVKLIEGSRYAWVFAALIALTREEGAILAWAVHVTFELSQPPRPGRTFRLARTTGLWLAIFAVGMGVQLAFAHGHGPLRAAGALSSIARVAFDPASRRALLLTLTDAVWLLAAGAVLLIVLGSSRRAALVGALSSLVLLPPLCVAAFAYPLAQGALRAHGLAWPPRFVLLWSLLVATLLLGIASSPQAGRWPRLAGVGGCLVVSLLSIAAQLHALRVCRGYDAWARLRTALFAPDALLSARLDPAEDAFLRCLGREVPRDAPVSSTGDLFGRFERQDVVWPNRLETAWARPQLVVCDEWGRLVFDYGCRDLRRSLRGFAEARISGLGVSYVPALAPPVVLCSTLPVTK